jgi:microcystin-dependent protein
MSQPFLGEIRMFAGTFAPANWAFCAGQLMDISQNAALFSLLGTTYGGDGVNTFSLPDLRSRMPVHAGTLGSTYIQGQVGGVETVTLAANQLPSHNHSAACSSTDGNSDNPSGKVPAGSATNLYTAPGANATMTSAIGLTGGNQPHENMPPFLAVNFIIALFGIFPSRN